MIEAGGWRDNARVLLVDGSDAELENLRARLASQHLVIDHAHSVDDARDRLKAIHYDAIVMNGGLAEPEGLRLIGEIQTPVILASLPADHDLMMSAYSAGAADFFCGSVSQVELVTRLRNLLNKRVDAPPQNLYQFGGAQFDLDQRQWSSNGRSVHLSHHEAAFLAALLESPRHFCTYAQLLDKIWGPSNTVETQNLRVLAGQLRRKIEPPGDHSPLLVTVTGVGYKLAMDQSNSKPNGGS